MQQSVEDIFAMLCSVLILDDSAQKSILRGSNVRTDVKRKTVSVS